MIKQIFVINGSGSVGKDTFVKYVSDYVPTTNFSSVDKVKEVARLIGWNGEKTEKDRKFLSDLKLLCTDYNDMPFNSMNDKIIEFLNSDSTFLFLHIREPNEIQRIKDRFNAKTILVERDSVEHITSNMADENVYNYNYDIVINNNGALKDLREKAECFSIDFFNSITKNEY